MKSKSPERIKSELWERLRPEVDSTALANEITKFLRQHVGESARTVNLANNIARYLLQKYSISDRKSGELHSLIERHPDDLDGFLDAMSFKEARVIMDNLDPLLRTSGKRRVKSRTQADAKQRRKRSKCRYERRRRLYREGLVIKQFGRDPEFSLVNLQYMSPESPCLDILFSGGAIRMAGHSDSLENLFGEDRHTFPKSLRHERSGRTKIYYLDAFMECLVYLLANRDGRKQWLPEGAQGERVLSGIIERAYRHSPEIGDNLAEKLRPFIQ
jgi:hypothetical protein